MEDFLIKYGSVLSFLFFIAVAVLSIYFGIKSKQALKLKLKNTAMKLGLQYNDSIDQMMDHLDLMKNANIPQNIKNNPMLGLLMKTVGTALPQWSLTGKYLGAEIDIRPVVRGSGKSSSVHTLIKVKFKTALGQGLIITKEGLFDKMGKSLLQTQDIEIGKPEFDKKVMIKGTDPIKVKSLLANPSLQNDILNLFNIFNTIIIQDDSIVYEFQGVLSDPEKYRNNLDALCKVARMF